MVFLSLSRWIRSRGPDRYWRVQEVLKHARHFRGRKNRCYSLAVRAVRRAFVKSTQARKAKGRRMRALWISRIAGAVREHGLKYPILFCNLVKKNARVAELHLRAQIAIILDSVDQKLALALLKALIKCQVALNRKVISDFAIYEPKTFKSLAALAQRRREEGFLAALGDGKEPEGIFSRIVSHH